MNLSLILLVPLYPLWDKPLLNQVENCILKFG